MGLTLTLFLYRYYEQQQSERLNKEFTFATEQIANNIHSRIYGYTIMMRGVKGYFQGSENVNFEEFKNYVVDLKIDKNISGIQGVGVVDLIPHSKKLEHITYLRQWQLKDYQIKPAGNRDFYAPITAMEPMNGDNLNAIGFDVFTLPAARSAMEKSRDLDIVAITSPITLVQDKNKSPSTAFVMYLPIFAKNLPINTVAERQAAIKSWVDVPFRISDLIKGLAGEISNDITLEIYDGLSISNQFRMYQSNNAIVESATKNDLPVMSRRLEIGGRSWTIVTKMTPAFVQRVSNPNQSLAIAFAGLSLSLMLGWISLILVSGRQKAQIRYKQLFAQAGEGVVILNSAHQMIDCNNAALNMFGYANQEFLNLSLQQILDKSQPDRLHDAINQLTANTSILKEWICLRKNGVTFTAEVSYSALDDGNYFLIIRDLTDRKKTEKQIQRLNKLYLALSETNQAIVRMGNENELLPLVCKCAVELGDMEMAWIGLIDSSSDKLIPVASYANNIDSFEDIKNLSISKKIPNKPIIINDLLSQLNQPHSNHQVTKFGWRSVASFPVCRNNKIYAFLTVYHNEIDAFDKTSIDLFTEMTGDISFALDNYDRENERIQAQKLLANSEEKLSTILNNVAAYIYLKDLNGRYLFANQQLLNLWNAKLDDVIGFGDEKFFDLATTERIREIDHKVLLQGETVEQEEINHIKQTDATRVYWSVKLPLRRTDGSIYGLCGISTDMTQQKLVEADLRIAAISFESQVGMVIIDTQKTVLKVNTAYTKISNYISEEVIGKMPSLICTDMHDLDFEQKIWDDVTNNGGWEGEVWNKRKNGEAYPQYLIVTAVKDTEQNIINYVASLTDVTESKAAAIEIEHLAFFDTLTQLPNRRLLLNRLSHALTASQRSGLFGGLLYLDIDHFKIINDSRGHDIGDLLLKHVSARLVECVRAEDTVARLGGDEYVIMLESLSKEPLEAASQIEVVAEKIQIALKKPYQLTTHQVSVTASIGLVLFSGQKQLPDELLKQADIAMYHAKNLGRNAFYFFDPDMQNSINMRVSLEEELRKAIAENQFILHYQVQVDIKGKPIGVEALIRWQHPERGLISPLHFIPIAEETGLILPIGQCVLNEACKQLKLWQQNEVTKMLSISINVSAKQFHQADFVEQVKLAVETHQIEAMLLKIELTESMLVDNIESLISAMNILRKVGVRFELDDFGTGYSSLQYLKRLPLYQLKIDQSFVRDITTDSSDKAIVKTIVKMAQNLGLSAIAEGVETKEQLQYLQEIGCTYYQGYLFSKPLHVNELEKLLSSYSKT